MDYFGGPGNDSFSGGEENDFALGGGGDDTLSGGGGEDFLHGGPGNDDLSGGDGDDRLQGAGGNDSLRGGAGHDFLGAGFGDDLVDGGAGFDRAGHFNTTSGVTVSLLLQGQPQNTGIGWKTYIDVEHLSGTPLSDTLIGDENDNWLWGSGGGDDLLIGNGGDDLLQVARGNHTVSGGSGVDTLSFGHPFELPGGVVVSLADQGVAQDTGQGLMTLTEIENLSGSWHGDVLTGDHRDNVLAGDGGSDVLTGGAGDDTLLGDGAFGVSAWAGAGAITTNERGGIESYELQQDGIVARYAPGDDTLIGGAGRDRLIGGGGRDVLIGGAGDDRFVFLGEEDSLAGAPDLIQDLRKGDVIDLSAIDADRNLDGDQAFVLVADGFTGTAGEAFLVFDKAARLTHLHLDTDGDKIADMTIDMVGNHTSFTDFSL